MGKVITTRANGSKRVYTDYPESEIADQKIKGADDSFREECDVNTILRKYMKTGEIEYRKNPGIYADISEITDLEGSLNQINKANAAFDALPADLRFRFRNDPVELINFLQDPKNDEESYKLGLRVAPESGPTLGRPQPSGSAVDKKQNLQNQNLNLKTIPKSKNQNLKNTQKNDDDLNDDDNA